MIDANSFSACDKTHRKEWPIRPLVAPIRSSFVMRQVARRGNPSAGLEGPQRR